MNVCSKMFQSLLFIDLKTKLCGSLQISNSHFTYTIQTYIMQLSIVYSVCSYVLIENCFVFVFHYCFIFFSTSFSGFVLYFNGKMHIRWLLNKQNPQHQPNTENSILLNVQNMKQWEIFNFKTKTPKYGWLDRVQHKTKWYWQERIRTKTKKKIQRKTLWLKKSQTRCKKMFWITILGKIFPKAIYSHLLPHREIFQTPLNPDRAEFNGKYHDQFTACFQIGLVRIIISLLLLCLVLITNCFCTENADPDSQ